jgi:hypothetical protein
MKQFTETYRIKLSVDQKLKLDKLKRDVPKLRIKKQRELIPF